MDDGIAVGVGLYMSARLTLRKQRHRDQRLRHIACPAESCGLMISQVGFDVGRCRIKVSGRNMLTLSLSHPPSINIVGFVKAVRADLDSSSRSLFTFYGIFC